MSEGNQDTIAALKAAREYVVEGVDAARRELSEVASFPRLAERKQHLVDEAVATLAAVDAALSALLDKPKTGWKLVPVEPTATMIAAALIDGSDDPDHEASSIGHQWVREAIYHAMLDAAPSHPTEGERT